ncbi:hypothetical protein F3J17_27155 [Burkholderia sp. Ax-1719]|nr:hypothetical protein [Burkholderia sp. Ax-1719]
MTKRRDGRVCVRSGASGILAGRACKRHGAGATESYRSFDASAMKRRGTQSAGNKKGQRTLPFFTVLPTEAAGTGAKPVQRITSLPCPWRVRRTSC